MIEFLKEHDYLVCLDSDGTVMDTMTIKHLRCFGPCFIEVFNITKNKEEIIKEWNDINLYRKTRGVNRFVGLDMIIEYSKKFGYSFDGSDEFHNWILTSKEYSVPAITAHLNDAKCKTIFELALLWSKRVNEEITKLPLASPFDGVIDVLKEASKSCDLVGVSSANPQAVHNEWSERGLIGYFKEVACQDKGNKTTIIKESMACGYDSKHTIMLGDAIGDLEAAKKNNCLFFPIVPKHEVECFKNFLNEGLKLFITDKFSDDYQKKLIDNFYASLEKGE